MNISIVRDNLINTIKNKEAMLIEMQKRHIKAFDTGDAIAISATCQFLKINIDELKRILIDVETCCDEDSTKVLLCSAV